MPTPASGQRLVALDAFRGATMAFMILVNNPGDGDHSYAPLQHAAWHGWTPTDVVFPSFMWIAGVALTLSFNRRIAEGVPRSTLFSHAARRAAIIFLLGLLVYAAPDFSLSTQRIPGVLQRIAIGYLAASAIYLTTRIRGQIAWILGLFTVYWLLMMLAPVPGCGSGHLDVDCNFAHYIDRIVLGQHNYHHTKTWDPEGLVSTLPAIATVLLGVLAGHIVRLTRPLGERITWLLVMGTALLVAGLVCDHWLPINKKLWTDSFALFMAGLDCFLFSLFLWIIDERGWQRWCRPLVILGMNAITIYLTSELIDEALSLAGVRDQIYEKVFAWMGSPNNTSLLYAIAYVLLNYAIAWWMYRRKWFLRV